MFISKLVPGKLRNSKAIQFLILSMSHMIYSYYYALCYWSVSVTHLLLHFVERLERKRRVNPGQKQELYLKSNLKSL